MKYEAAYKCCKSVYFGFSTCQHCKKIQKNPSSGPSCVVRLVPMMTKLIGKQLLIKK